MGDEGKLPATKTTEGAVPDMTGPNEGPTPSRMTAQSAWAIRVSFQRPALAQMPSPT